MNDILRRKIELATTKAWKKNMSLTRLALITVAIDEYREIAKRQGILKDLKTVAIQQECIQIVNTLMQQNKINPLG